jgi:NAD(P)-dependent dehydrogenase (short-subunit alcohol dehydrogenase family)
MINLIDLTGKTIIVTGASSGIGRETAILLSKLGAKLIIIARNKEKLSDTINSLDREGHTDIAFDLTSFSKYSYLYSRIFENCSNVSGFVHCAGFSKLIPLRNMNLTDIDEMMKINYYSFMLLAKEFVKKKNVHPDGASIVAISSIAGDSSVKGKSIYSATKSSLNISVKALAQEYARRNIRFNTVSPGWVRTELTDKGTRVLTSERLKNVFENYPLGAGYPIDVAKAVAFLLSDAARWITGTTLTVDGGVTTKAG